MLGWCLFRKLSGTEIQAAAEILNQRLTQLRRVVNDGADMQLLTVIKAKDPVMGASCAMHRAFAVWARVPAASGGTSRS
jgi:hypothetical protein